MNFTDLTQLALLGTGRASLPETPAGTPLSGMAAAIDRADPESAMLGLASLSALHTQAGQLPARDVQPATAAAGAETQPYTGAVPAGHLSGFLSGENPELLPEWLRLCAGAGCMVPPELLPALLSFRPNDEPLRALKLPVLGARGRWLAAFSPSWAWVLGASAEDESAWETGEPPARRALLRRVRLRDPARARELLALTWKDDTPEDRAAFAATIALNLQPEDEPFLTACLEDKRKEVRRAAFETLSRLPQSAFASRMLARMEPLMTYIPGESGSLLKLRKSKPAVLEVRLPDACDKPMQKDGIEPKPPKGTGEKTWWLLQLLQSVPLSAWEAKWQASPEELILAAQSAESGKDTLQAWSAAARTQRNAAWALALLRHAPVGDLGELLELLPPAERDQWYAGAFKNSSPDAAVALLHQLISDPAGEMLTPQLSATVLNTLRTICSTRLNYSDYTLRSQLRLLALILHPDTLDSAQSGWPAEPTEAWAFWQTGVDPFLQLCHLRTAMREALGGGGGKD